MKRSGISTAALAYASLFPPPAALGNATQRATLVGLITESVCTNSAHNHKKKRNPRMRIAFFMARSTEKDIISNSLINSNLSFK